MLIVNIWEGLGNQMFQYAFAKSYEIRTGKKVFLDCKGLYNNKFPDLKSSRVPRTYELYNFNISLNVLGTDEKISDYKNPIFKPLQDLRLKMILKGVYPFHFITDLDRVTEYQDYFYNAKRSIYAKGWFQTEEYFKAIRPILLKEFTPKAKIKINRQLRHLLETKNTVAIHIRRRDFKYLRLTIPIHYFYQGIDFIKQNVEHPVFMVFSDEIEWARTHLNLADDIYFVNEQKFLKDYEELAIMSCCKHQIIANSTFSWWGAWLNRNPDKIVIAPAYWPGVQKNIVPKEWIRL